MSDNKIFNRATFVPLVIRQAVIQSSESIPTNLSNLKTMFSSMLFAPATIGFITEKYNLTIKYVCIMLYCFYSRVHYVCKFSGVILVYFL